MPRAKKDGVKISLYVDRATVAELRAYAAEKGQTLTMALERLIRAQLAREAEGDQHARSEIGYDVG